MGADVRRMEARVRVVASSCAGVAESRKERLLPHNLRNGRIRQPHKSWLTDPAVAQVVWPEMRRFCLGLGVVDVWEGKIVSRVGGSVRSAGRQDV